MKSVFTSYRIVLWNETKNYTIWCEHGFSGVRKNAPGNPPPEKCPPENCPPENCPPEISPPRKLLPGKNAPLGGIFPGGIFPEGIFTGGIFPSSGFSVCFVFILHKNFYIILYLCPQLLCAIWFCRFLFMLIQVNSPS